MEKPQEELIINTVGLIPNDIKKSNQLIHSKYKLNILQQKILFLALAKAKMDTKKNLVTATVSVPEIRKYTGITSNSIYERTRDASVNLATLYILDESPENKQYRVRSGIIDDVFYDNGTMYFEFGQKYNSLVYNLKSNYTLLNMATYMSLSSSYSLRLYELLKSESYKGNGISKEMTISDIKLSLGMVEMNEKMRTELNKNSSIELSVLIEKYADKDITWAAVKKTLEAAIEEINEKTDINVTTTQIRSGKGGKIDGLSFKITQKKYLEDLQKDEEVTKEITEEELDELVDELKEIIEEKIKTRDCKTLLKKAEYDVGKIKEKYEIMKMSSSTINDIVAWLIKAIEDNYQMPVKKEVIKEKREEIEEESEERKYHNPNGKNQFNNFNQRVYTMEEMDEIEKRKLMQ